MHSRLRPIFSLMAIVSLSGCGGGTGEPLADNTIATVGISSSATTIPPGSSVQFTATAKNATGATISGVAPAWTSSNQSVATVNGTGLVTGIATGSSVVRATVGAVFGERTIVVQTVATVPTATVAAGTGNVFQPTQVDLTVGGTVTWQFGATTHNVTFETTGSGTPANIANTANQSESRTFSTAGNFPYQCTLHAGMTGTVTVR